ncbi:Protein O-mannose kinase [Amphibalanus amphitrite]|uniref:Protein O-mannose kinase n=1 Tax=Amphibalanus amphitrite TaxID=1232801 RepID=A0A6A4X797_AMPAM|nr:Protein O-mannose kinase [Amphibalanus amphitrite]
MSACTPLLGCPELAEVEILEQVGQGSTKSVYRGLWRGHQVALAALAEPSLRADFHHGLQMLRSLSPSEHVVQLVGFCGDVIVTEFHRRGDASAAADLVRTAGGAAAARLALRLCRSYAAALAFLHNSPVGRRVMCDSNDLQKTLQQWLLTADGRLVAADLDALPDASAGPVRCGRRPIEGEFAAPEQRWRHGREPPGYDEKTDVWKLAAVCEHFLSAAPDGEYLKLELHGIHKRCRSVPARLRPSAADMVEEYDRVVHGFSESEYVSPSMVSPTL